MGFVLLDSFEQIFVEKEAKGFILFFARKPFGEIPNASSY